jgi:hypothetical protein
MPGVQPGEKKGKKKTETYIISLELRRSLVALGHECHRKRLAHDLCVSGLELGRVQRQALEEATVGVFQFQETVSNLHSLYR